MNPLLERAILDRIDADLFYKAATFGVAISEAGDSLVYTTVDTMRLAKELLRPWIEKAGNSTGGGATIEDMAVEWLQKFGDGGNGELLRQSD